MSYFLQLPHLLQTYNFSVVLLVKMGILKDDQYNRLPLPFMLNADRELTGTPEDPLQYLTLSNVVSSPSLMADGTPWCGSHEISDVLYQVILRCVPSPGNWLRIC